MPLPYIDIHTHQIVESENSFQLYNHIVGQDEYYDSIICSAGIHPWYITEENKELLLESLETLSTQTNVLAIGECGLDKVCNTDWNLQVLVFEQQIQLANRIAKPLIIHCVRAYQEIFDILKNQKVAVPVLFHGFNKNKILAQSILKQDYYISLGTAILNGSQDELIKEIDLNKLFLETDNKSTNIVDIYSYFCNVRNISLEKLQEQLVKNLENVFSYSI